jgi:hypothetical protein
MPRRIILTTEEESMLLTCIANGVPLCCARGGEETAAQILRSKRSQSAFAEFAYDRMGCGFDIAEHQDTWNRYLDNLIDWLSALRVATGSAVVN